MQKYYTSVQLFFALQNESYAAIHFLDKKIRSFITHFCYKRNISTCDAEEIVNDALMMTITHIKKGKFIFRGSCPSVYACEIGKKMALNFAHKNNKRFFCDISEMEILTEDGSSDNWENRMIVAFLMRQVSPSQRKLLLLQMQGYSDKEICDSNYVSYHSERSLITTRNRAKAKLQVWKPYL